MKLMEEIFFSFTFGGETLSLAASLATLTKLQREPVTSTLQRRGTTLMDGVRRLIDANGLSEVLAVAGHPSWSFLVMKDSTGVPSFELKTLFLQEVFARAAGWMSTCKKREERLWR